MSVILYHAKFTWRDFTLLPGGFLGVDIFFVISGYLITTLLVSELNASGRISLLNFYERRARRLLPALLLVMLVSLPFAWNLMLPEQLVDFSRSLIASLFFSSNFYWDFSLQQYEAESALLKPFLHTWSLAVEEQYYIIFPLLLLAICRSQKCYLAWILWAGLLISLVLAQWMTGVDTSFSFYMLPTRFWELLAGSLLALHLLDNPTRTSPSTLIKLFPTVGMLMIIASLVGIRLDSHHPGFITLIPVLGTILIIGFNTDGDWVSRTLSRSSLVYIGLLSYSLYLWHYPIFAFGRIVATEPSAAHKITWVVMTLVLSVLSYRLVEKPFRNRKLPTKLLLTSLVCAYAVVITIATYWIQEDGIPQRTDYVGGLLHASISEQNEQNGHPCLSGIGALRPVSQSCVFNNFPEAPTLVLVGDSHAAELAGALKMLARENQLNFVQITQIGCPHVGGIFNTLCRGMGKPLEPFLSNFENVTIVYSARLPLYIEWEPFDNQEGFREAEKPNMAKSNGGKGTIAQRANQVVATLSNWVNAGHDLVIVYPVPEQGFHVSQLLNMGSSRKQSAEELPLLSTSYEVFKARVASSYKALDQVSGPGVSRIYPETLFCSDESGRCIASAGDRIYFYTDNHVSRLGSHMIVRQVADKLQLKVPGSFLR